ncbi:MAG: prolipoprotein diacylglyceryl transferase, partial [Gemmatimonadota bacterium]
GGLIGGILCVILWLRWRKYPLRAAVDSCAVAIPVGYMLGRTGCFLVGDDYGKPTDLAWGVAFPEGSPPTTVPVHPTQLYEIAMTLPIFLLLWSQRKKGYPDGFLFFEFMVLAGIERFVVEFWRVNVEIAFGLTAAQWFAIGFVVIGVAGIAWVRRHPVHTTPRETPAPA